MILTKEQNQSLLDKVLASMENNFQKVQEFQHDLGKAAIDLVRKQQDLLISFQQNYYQLEDESKKIFAEFIETGNGEINSDSWNERAVEIAGKIEPLVERTSQNTLRFLENSQQKMYEFTKEIVSEQMRQQKEMVENIKGHLNQMVELQSEIVKFVEDHNKMGE